MTITQAMLDGRRVLHYGGGLLCLGFATWLFLSSPPATSPMARPGAGGVPVQGSAWFTVTRGSILLYGVGFVLLVTGGRSDAERHGYNF